MGTNGDLKLKRERLILLIALSLIVIKKFKQIVWRKKLRKYPDIYISLN